MSAYKRKKILGLLETAHVLAITMEDNNLAVLIGRAIDKARANIPGLQLAPREANPRPAGTRRQPQHR